MSPKAKKEYVKAILERYRNATKKQKRLILDEFCIVCGYHRKYAIAKLNTFNANIPIKRPGKPSPYNHPDILEPLIKIWMTANMPASKRLVAMIPQWLKFLDVPRKIQAKLLAISPPTIDRLLKTTRIQFKPRGLSTTKPGTMLRNQIPVKVNQWDEFKPGFLEADTVAHCGGSLDGHYAVTLDCVDIATGWTEQRATWGLNHRAVLTQIKHIESTLPFKLLGFDSDCGGEFINYDLLLYLHYRKDHPVQFTRSRPYRKNDNAHIEQKNWTHVRQWLGYDRLDNSLHVQKLNELYTQEWRLFFNFFLPSVKIIRKNRIGSRVLKKYDLPKTPYERILESPFIDNKSKQKLRQQYQSLNPFHLRTTIDKKLQLIANLR